MNRNIVIVLLMLTLEILTGIPESLARPEYLTDLTAVYGDGSCGTCHIRASGGGPRNSYGKEERDISEETDTSTGTSVTARGTQAASGFEFAFSLAGLLAGAFLARRINK
jgi:mono/diheme cytochrome c family protein